MSLKRLQDGKPVYHSLKSPACSCISITAPDSGRFAGPVFARRTAKLRRSSQIEAIIAIFADPVALGFTQRRIIENGMKRLITAVGLMLLFACQPLTTERSTLARVTVYWRGEGSGEYASSNGERLRESSTSSTSLKFAHTLSLSMEL